ncbi:MAG: hypothetical protein ACI4TX_00010 [Christensenellales bacterium]
MKNIIDIEIEDEKYKKFEAILAYYKNNIEQVLRIIVEKTINDNSIDWLYTAINGEVRTKNTKMKKAIQLFNEKGYYLMNNHNTNFASKNNKNNVYWINPNKRHLDEDWYIILDDNINKRLYLLSVPQNSISGLKMRNDKICNVSIRYNVDNFIDINSGIYFKQYLVDMLEYKSLLK